MCIRDRYWSSVQGRCLFVDVITSRPNYAALARFVGLTLLCTKREARFLTGSRTIQLPGCAVNVVGCREWRSFSSSIRWLMESVSFFSSRTACCQLEMRCALATDRKPCRRRVYCWKHLLPSVRRRYTSTEHEPTATAAQILRHSDCQSTCLQPAAWVMLHHFEGFVA